MLMNDLSLTNTLSRFFDIRPGEARRVGIMVSLFFFLLAANNVIKVVRDALFLSRFPISDLAYVYLSGRASCRRHHHCLHALYGKVSTLPAHSRLECFHHLQCDPVLVSYSGF